jgi:polyphosphate kinase
MRYTKIIGTSLSQKNPLVEYNVFVVKMRNLDEFMEVGMGKYEDFIEELRKLLVDKDISNEEFLSKWKSLKGRYAKMWQEREFRRTRGDILDLIEIYNDEKRPSAANTMKERYKRIFHELPGSQE